MSEPVEVNAVVEVQEPHRVLEELTDGYRKLVRATIILGGVMALLIVGIAAFALQTRAGICNLRDSQQVQIEQAEVLYAEQPELFRQFGVTEEEFRIGQERDKATVEALDGLWCG
jgi:hypothetical protein